MLTDRQGERTQAPYVRPCRLRSLAEASPPRAVRTTARSDSGFGRDPGEQLVAHGWPLVREDAVVQRIAARTVLAHHVAAQRPRWRSGCLAWQRHTDAAPAPFWRTHLCRLGTLTPPQPRPEGRGRVTGEKEHEQVVRWCREFRVDVGERPSIDLIDALQPREGVRVRGAAGDVQPQLRGPRESGQGVGVGRGGLGGGGKLREHRSRLAPDQKKRNTGFLSDPP